MANDLRLQVLLQAMDKASGPLRNIAGGSKAAATALRNTRDRLKELTLAQQNIDGFRETKNAAQESAVALRAAQQRAKQLREEVAASEAPTKKAAAAYNRAEREVTHLKNAHLANLRAVRDRRAVLTQAGISIKGLNTEQRRLSTATAEAAAQLYKQKYALQQVSMQTGRLAAMERARQANLATRSAVGGKLMGAVGAAVVAGYGLSRVLGSGNEFDYQLQLIGNTADMTGAQVADMRSKVLAASKATGQSAATVQSALGFLVAAGQDADTASRSILAIGRTSTAAGADIEDVSRAAFTLTDALNIKPEGLQKALDILAQAGKEGNVELRDMARQLPVLGAGFRSLKMGGNEAAATMGAALEIARKGAGDADEAANNLKNYLQKILSPVTLKKAQDEFGLDLYKVIQDAQSSGGNPFEASIEAVLKATGGDQKKLGELFQDMQAQNFLKPVMQNWGEYQRIKAKSLAATGVTDRDFAKVSATAKQRLDNMAHAAGRLGLAFNATLAPALGRVADVLTPLLDRFTVFVQAHPKLVSGIARITAGVVALRIAALGTRYAWTFMVGGLFSTATKLPVVATGVQALTVAMGSLEAVTLPIWGVAAALAVVVGFLAWKYWGPIKAYATGFGSALAEDVTPAVNGLIGALGPLKSSLDGVLSPMKATTDQLNQFSDAGSYFGKTVGFVFKAAIDPLKKTVDLLNVILVLLEKFKASTPTDTFGQRVAAARNPLGTFIHALATPLPGPGVHWNTGAATDRLPPAPIHWNTGAATDRTPAPAIDRSPPLQAPGAGSASNTTNVGGITIVQQPGEDSEALARRVRAELDRRDRAKAAATRSRLRDTE